jgi:hypothetical protein
MMVHCQQSCRGLPAVPYFLPMSGTAHQLCPALACFNRIGAAMGPGADVSTAQAARKADRSANRRERTFVAADGIPVQIGTMRYLIRYWKLALLEEERTDISLDDAIKLADANMKRHGATTVTIQDTEGDIEVYRLHITPRS